MRRAAAGPAHHRDSGTCSSTVSTVFDASNGPISAGGACVLVTSQRGISVNSTESWSESTALPMDISTYRPSTLDRCLGPADGAGRGRSLPSTRTTTSKPTYDKAFTANPSRNDHSAPIAISTPEPSSPRLIPALRTVRRTAIDLVRSSAASTCTTNACWTAGAARSSTHTAQVSTA